MTKKVTFQFESLPNIVKKFLVDNEDNVNPCKIIAMLHYEGFNLEEDDEDEELQNLLEDLGFNSYNESYMEASYGESWYVFDEEEALSELSYARDTYIDSVKSDISSSFHEYVDWDQIAEDAYTDIYDVFPDSSVETIRVSIEGYPEESSWNTSIPTYYVIVKE